MHDGQRWAKQWVGGRKWLVSTNGLGRVVQMLDNPGLSKKYGSICFSKEKITVLIKYCSDSPWEKLVNNKFTAEILLCKVGNKIFNPGLAHSRPQSPTFFLASGAFALGTRMALIGF